MSMQESIRTVLQNTLEEIEIRSQVDSCVRELVTDVELSVQLQQQLQNKYEIVTLRRQLTGYENAIAESYILKELQTKQNKELADHLAIELWNVSRELGSLLSIKEEHEELLIKYDELIAKLLQAEDEVAEARQLQQQQQQQQGQQRQGQQQNTVNTTTTKEQQQHQSEQQRTEKGGQTIASGIDTVPSTSEDSLPPPTSMVHDDKVTAATVEPTKFVENSADNAPQTPDPAPAPNVAGLVELDSTVEEMHDSDPAVVIIEDDNDENGNGGAPPSLDQLESDILLNIFVFLDPMDVLNVAQINIAMYSRVDTLFNAAGGDFGEEAESSEVMEEKSPKQVSQPQPEKTEPPVTVVSLPVSAVNDATTVINPVPATITPAQPTMVTIPPSATTVALPLASTTVTTSSSGALVKGFTPQANVTSNAAAASTGTSTVARSTTAATAAPGSRGIFSILQPKLRAPLTPTRSPVDSAESRSQQQESIHEKPFQPLNAAMASSMAAKLSDTELNAIILMTERLKQKEQLAAQYKTERDALASKLDGTESVKQFLITKVRDMEASLNASFNNEIKVAQQVESDQEVIAFLDGQVQELERKVKTLQDEKHATILELESVRKQSNEKAVVMGDMLQFERERLQENEREWKATKKVLIKEVKNLRTQIAALQAERDGYREEKEALYRAINNPNYHQNVDRPKTYT